jgi:hypothetical protein
MAINAVDLKVRLERVEQEVASIREELRKATSSPVDVEALSASIASHAMTDEDTTTILDAMRREEKDWWKTW